MNTPTPQKPTAAFIGASWLALVIGMTTFLFGLWNASMALSEKGYYLTLLLFGLFAAISVQKSVRDRAERVRTTNLYYGIAWFAVTASITLLTIGLINAPTLSLSEKGFYGIAFTMSLFAAVAVQKNVRDLEAFTLAQAESFENERAVGGPIGSRGPAVGVPNPMAPLR